MASVSSLMLDVVSQHKGMNLGKQNSDYEEMILVLIAVVKVVVRKSLVSPKPSLCKPQTLNGA